MDSMLRSLTEFDTRDGRTLAFVRASKNYERVVCWEDYGVESGWSQLGCKIISSDIIVIEDLKSLKIWEHLSPEKQADLESGAAFAIAEVESAQNGEVGEVGVQENKPRRKRRDLTGIPDHIECGCGYIQKYTPSAIASNAERKGKTVQEYIADFQCQTCNPTKGGGGRKVDPQYAHLPKELTCKCGNVAKTSTSALVAASGRKNITPEEYVKRYECQTCNPTKGNGRGRTANPEYAHLPKELTCKCGATVKTSGSALVAAAERRKVTPEEYIEGYQCQTCNPTRVSKKVGAVVIEGVEKHYRVTCTLCKLEKGTSLDQMTKISKQNDLTLAEAYAKYVCKTCNSTLPEGERFLKRKISKSKGAIKPKK